MDMSYLKEKPIAILGGGAVGKTMAGDCALAGSKGKDLDFPRLRSQLQKSDRTGINNRKPVSSFYGFEAQRQQAVSSSPNRHMAEAQ